MPNIEELIRKAFEEGKFENLPGNGRPLQLDDNPFEDPDWRLANHVLRNAGFTLPWLETRREIEAALVSARNDLKRAWNWQKDARASDLDSRAIDHQWQQSVDKFREQIADINQRITSYNLETPSTYFQLSKIRVERELQLTTSDQSDTLTGT